MSYKKTILFIFFLVLMIPYATFYTGSINMITEARPISVGGDNIVYMQAMDFNCNDFFAPKQSNYGPLSSLYNIFSKTLAFRTTKTDQAYIIFLHYLFIILPILLGLYLFIHKTSTLKLLENKEGKTPFFPFVFAMGIIVTFLYFIMRRVPFDTNHLASIFIMMSIFSLAQDNFRLKKHFIVAWIFWVLAFCIHFFAISFAVPMAIYLFLVWIKGEIPFLGIVKTSLKPLGLFLGIAIFMYTVPSFFDLKYFLGVTNSATNYRKLSVFRWFKLSSFLLFYGILSANIFYFLYKKIKNKAKVEALPVAVLLSAVFISEYFLINIVFPMGPSLTLKRMSSILFPLLITVLLGFSSFFKKRYRGFLYLGFILILLIGQNSKMILGLPHLFKNHHRGFLSKDYKERHSVASLVLTKIDSFLVQEGFKSPFYYWPENNHLFPENLHKICSKKNRSQGLIGVQGGWPLFTWLSDKKENNIQFILRQKLSASYERNPDQHFKKYVSQHLIDVLRLQHFAQKSNCGKKMKDISGFNKISSRFYWTSKAKWRNIKLTRYLEPFKHPYEKELQQANYVLYVWRKCP